MKVYIEFVIIDNLVLTASIAGLSYAIAGKRIHKRRTLAASVIGTALSITYPFWMLPTPLLIVAKLAVGVLLAVILFARLERPVLGIILFFAMTGAVGGLCLFVNYIAAGNIASALLGAPVLPYCVPAAIGAATFFTARTVLGAAKRRRTRSAYIYDVCVTLNGKAAKLKGYLDSGNLLYDDAGLPIIVTKLSSLERAFGRREIMGLVGGYKAINSVNGSAGKLFLIRPDKFLLYSGKKTNTYSDVMLGVCVRGFDRGEDMLLHPSIIGG